MAKETELFNRFQDKWCKLVFNETMILLSKDDQVFFTLPEELYSWSFRIIFSTGGIPVPSDIFTEFKEKETVLTLNNWFSETGVYNLDPLRFSSKDTNQTLFIKLRTIANHYQDHRTLTISIWKMM
ncbi:MAG: hypothetical protein IPP51_01765 [Bacteroidetes bacterium]|nr:hypothetical protein [Bacteroidota bacterium]